jgi:hypothetical protein
MTRPALRRALDGDAFPSAYREDTSRGPHTGRWRISISDLRAAGHVVDLAALERNEATTDLTGEVGQLRDELGRERARRVAAEERVRELEEALTTLDAPEAASDDAAPLTWQATTRERTGLRGNWLR